ncbi:MAG: Mur ligase family protein, partial [Patescibacteria group bacterium]
VAAKCDWAIIEMTSEGAKQYRHEFISPTAFIFTNLAPEHLESHGSYEKYVAAKLSIAESLRDVMIINGDDKEASKFLALPAKRKFTYRLKDAEPYTATDHGLEFTWRGSTMRSPLAGEFNLSNWLAALTFGESQNIAVEKMKEAVAKLDLIKGRVEKIKANGFDVIVDYAHTPDSLRAVYQTFAARGKVCVLGNTGGGRDKWKRPLMGQIAAEHCRQIILTDEDPYDEDPKTILDEMIVGIKTDNYKIILDRRVAIRTAMQEAKPGEVVIITGKGTDPYIMGPKGQKTPWSDAEVVREELNHARITGS